MFNIVKSAFLGSVMGLVMVQVVACQNSSRRVTAKTIAERDAEAKKEAKPKGAESTGSSGGTTLKATADVVSRTLQVLDQSHQIFGEAWKLVTENKNAKKTSVFQQTEMLLEGIQNTNCDDPKKDPAKAVPPNHNRGGVRPPRRGRNVEASTSSSVSDGGSTTGADASAPKDPNADGRVATCRVHINGGASDNQPTSLNFYYTYPGDNVNTTGIAYFSYKSETEVNLQFLVKALTDGVGSGLQALQIAHNNPLVNVITCTATLDNSKAVATVTKLSCQPGLGQSKDRNNHYYFKTFEYDTAGTDVLHAIAYLYDGNLSPDPTGATVAGCFYEAKVPQGANSTIDVAEDCQGKAAVPAAADLLAPMPQIKPPAQLPPPTTGLDSTIKDEPAVTVPPKTASMTADGADDSGALPETSTPAANDGNNAAPTSSGADGAPAAAVRAGSEANPQAAQAGDAAAESQSGASAAAPEASATGNGQQPAAGSVPAGSETAPPPSAPGTANE